MLPLAPEDELELGEEELGEAELDPPLLDLSLEELDEAPELGVLGVVDAEPDIEPEDEGEVLEPEDDEGLDGVLDEDEAPVEDLPPGLPVRSHP